MGVYLYQNNSELAMKNAYIGEYVPPIPYLCFTAEQANSTVKLNKNKSPTAVTLETSTDLTTWATYTIGTDITLSNIGDKVYFRNTSETTTGFSITDNHYYQFSMTGSVAASGDVTSLINKNLSTTVSAYCFAGLFQNCTSLTTCPEIPATTIQNNCYIYMFAGCTNLTTLPKLPATTLALYCYAYMFYRCSKIKLSLTQTGEYQTPYIIPTTGTGTNANNALNYMFANTGGTFAGTPAINTTYYTSNTIV